MSNHASPSPTITANGPVARLGESAVAVVAYLGGVALLAVEAAAATYRPWDPARPFRAGLVRQMGWLMLMGFPLVSLVHVPLGSFLAMQAYFGATFVEAAGPVVGLGLFRNAAPLMAGLTLAGMLSTRLTAELRGRSRPEFDREPGWVADRDVTDGSLPDPRPPADSARLAAVRILAAALVGPLLGLWGAVVGTLVGMLVARAMLGVPGPIFLGKFLEMFWTRDVVGLVVKGTLFGGGSALFACFEGLRGDGGTSSGSGTDALPFAAFRAMCLSALLILLINMAWFLLAYHAGPAFGPTVLNPPTP